MPAVKKVGDQTTLVRCDTYPHAKFPFEFFNPVQSRVCEFYDQDCNAIISAKTSAGKTIVSELIASYQVRVNKSKIIYLAPMRALAKEKYDDWTTAGNHFADLKVSICTGDYRLTPERQKELNDADIIILTTEMLNSRTRNFNTEKNDWLTKVGAVICDESHLLTVPGRGDHAEIGLMNFTEINPKARLVLLSATMPNVGEIADWVSYVLNKKETYLLESNYRPCPLGIHYETYWADGGYENQEAEKVNAAMQIVEDNPDDKFLLFVHTKRTGELLKKAMEKGGYKAEFHSAELDKNQREKLESRFKSKDKDSLQYLIATSTLAWGCYDKNTLVNTADGSLCKIKNIKEGDFVFGYNGNSFEKNEVLRVGCKTVDDVLQITLSTGENFKVSLDHEFFGAIDRKSPNFESAKNFKVGDYISVPSNLQIYSSDLIADDFGYLVGYVMGDGSKSKCGIFKDKKDKVILDIAFGGTELNHLEYVKNIFSKIIGYSFKKNRIDKNGVYHLSTKHRETVEKFNFLPIGRRKNRLSLFDLPRKDGSFIKGVLQALFDSDGGFSSHSNGHASIEFNTISKKLASEVQQMLLYFGVRSCIGKKKMKKSVINGRLQVPKRKYIYRVRIYKNQIDNFLNNVGFRLEIKSQYGKYFLENCKETYDKDVLPCRTLIKEHAVANSVSPYKMMKEVGCDYWNCLNKSDLLRKTCENILEKYPNHSGFSDLVKSPIRFSKIISIKHVVKNCDMWDIEVDKTHNFIGNGVISHNCNTPARRVVILGVHRGISEVETYDIWQMAGRSGRPGYDPRGDVYILLPSGKEERHRTRLANPTRIESKLLDNIGGHYKTLAFHLASAIHHGKIKTKEDVHDWYSRTLAYFQTKGLKDEIVDSTLELMLKCGVIKEDKGIYKVTVVGMVSSMYYYSPFDVADLRKNFMALFNNGEKDNDLYVSMALGNVDSLKMGIVSKAEREEMGIFAAKVAKEFGKDAYNEAAIKGGFAYYMALTGGNAGAVAAVQRNLQWDFPRLVQVLQAVDSMGCKWDESNYLTELQSRVSYGVPPHLVKFIKLPDIGRVRAERLFNLGFKNLQDIVDKPDVVRSALNMKAEKVLDIITAAKGLILTGED